MTRAYSIADNSTPSLPLSPPKPSTLKTNPPTSTLPPLLLNSKHAPQTQTRHSNSLVLRLGHASHLAAATHSHAALRQASPAQQDDAEAVWA